MNKELLKLKPKRYLCPYCGKWHNWELSHELGYYDSPAYQAKLGCVVNYKREMSCYFVGDNFHFKTNPTCERGNLDINDSISIESIVESSEKPRVTFAIPFTANSYVNSSECYNCTSRFECLMVKLGDENNSLHMHITFGFEFEQSDYEKFSNVFLIAREGKELQEREDAISSMERALKEHEDAVSSKAQVSEQPQVKQNTKEDNNMAKTTILEQLYEHSPKENIDIAKEWVSKYKPTLKWAVPVVAIYSAYRILNSKNSGFDIGNIYSEGKKKLGFELESLKDKVALNHLMVLGGLSATAYAAIKGISSIYGTETGEIDEGDLENWAKKLDGVRKKFGWIQPKTEALLPVAVSVIIVYVMTQKPAWFEMAKEKASAFTGNFSNKMSVYLDMAKLFVSDKLKLDLDNEEEVKKMKSFAFLAAIVGIGVFLFGKKILGDKAADDGENTGLKNEKLEAFMGQLLSIMKKLMPTAFAGFATFLITKNVMKDDVIDAEFFEVVDAEEKVVENDTGSGE